jgi:hypothetical protein
MPRIEIDSHHARWRTFQTRPFGARRLRTPLWHRQLQEEDQLVEENTGLDTSGSSFIPPAVAKAEDRLSHCRSTRSEWANRYIGRAAKRPQSSACLRTHCCSPMRALNFPRRSSSSLAPQDSALLVRPPNPAVRQCDVDIACGDGFVLYMVSYAMRRNVFPEFTTVVRR